MRLAFTYSRSLMGNNDRSILEAAFFISKKRVLWLTLDLEDELFYRVDQKLRSLWSSCVAVVA